MYWRHFSSTITIFNASLFLISCLFLLLLIYERCRISCQRFILGSSQHILINPTKEEYVIRPNIVLLEKAKTNHKDIHRRIVKFPELNAQFCHLLLGSTGREFIRRRWDFAAEENRRVQNKL